MEVQGPLTEGNQYDRRLYAVQQFKNLQVEYRHQTEIYYRKDMHKDYAFVGYTNGDGMLHFAGIIPMKEQLLILQQLLEMPSLGGGG